MCADVIVSQLDVEEGQDGLYDRVVLQGGRPGNEETIVVTEGWKKSKTTTTHRILAP